MNVPLISTPEVDGDRSPPACPGDPRRPERQRKREASMTPAARAEVQRILDRPARRLLDARLERQAVETAPGRDCDAEEDGLDKGSALVQVQEVPLPISVDDEGGVEGG